MTPRNHDPRRTQTDTPIAHSSRLAISLQSGDDPGSVVTNALALPIDANALGADGDAPRSIRLEVIPPPDANGYLPSRDGRPQRVRDAAKLVATLNGQTIGARVDRDHRSEPRSKTFAGTTEAEGWVSNYRLNARGGVDADAELDPELITRLRMKKYRYVSPALLLNAANDVVGLSSVAVVNNPNLPLPAPAVNSTGSPMDKDELKAKQSELDERESKIQAREAAAKTLLENAAEQAVDQAIVAGTILPAQKDYHLSAIKAHGAGIEKGIEAFNAFTGTGAGNTGVATTVLTRRVGPTGKPPSGRDQAPAFPVPNGWQPPGDERIELHSQIAAYAQKRGIPYVQAVTEFGANNGI